MSKNNLNFAGFAKGYKRNIPSDVKDDIIVFDRSGKQISLSDTDFIPKNLKELNNDGFISDWALASRKPIYNFSEITDKPNTLAGYEIEDAVDLFTEQTISGAKTFTKSINENAEAVMRFGIADTAIKGQSVYVESNGMSYGIWGFNPNTMDLVIGQRGNGDYFDGDVIINTHESGALRTATIKVDKIMIGDCLITWDNVNKCVKFSTGVASDSFVSAGGVHK